MERVPTPVLSTFRTPFSITSRTRSRYCISSGFTATGGGTGAVEAEAAAAADAALTNSTNSYRRPFSTRAAERAPSTYAPLAKGGKNVSHSKPESRGFLAVGGAGDAPSVCTAVFSAPAAATSSTCSISVRWILAHAGIAIASSYTEAPPMTNTFSMVAPASVSSPSSSSACGRLLAQRTPLGSSSESVSAVRLSTTFTRSSSGRNFVGIDCHVLRPMMTALRFVGSRVERVSCLK